MKYLKTFEHNRDVLLQIEDELGYFVNNFILYKYHKESDTYIKIAEFNRNVMSRFDNKIRFQGYENWEGINEELDFFDLECDICKENLELNYEFEELMNNFENWQKIYSNIEFDDETKNVLKIFNKIKMNKKIKQFNI